MMLPNISNTMKPSGGLIRHSSSPAHFLSKMAMEEMASVDHELNGISSSGAYNPHGQRKRGRGGVLEVPDKNNIQQQFGQVKTIQFNVYVCVCDMCLVHTNNLALWLWLFQWGLRAIVWPQIKVHVVVVMVVSLAWDWDRSVLS